jgi:YD repeat-containing protein
MGKIRKYLTGLFITVSLINSEAQVSSVIPPSPISCEFDKYINFEVSLYNGIPEISVPLYTIQLKGLTIPVSLSYHASGIKFEQESGDAGLGWVLNPGYRVSRSIYGYADENKPMPKDIIQTLNTYESKTGVPLGNFERDKYLAQFVCDDPFKTISKFDSEYDQFTYSYPNGGGGFIISDRNNKVVTTNEASNTKFDYVTGSSSACTNISGIKGFGITDAMGIKYSFGEYNMQTSCAIERNNSANPYSSNAAVAWGLTDILTPVGDAVNFRYVTGIVGGVGSSKNFSITEANPAVTYSLSSVSQSLDFRSYYTTFFPSEIVTPNERVVFIRYSDNRLNYVQIFTSRNELVKSFKFFYHTGNFRGHFSSPYYLLDSVTISDANTQRIGAYRFNYYPAPAGQDPSAADQWGYIAPGDPQKYFHKDFEDDLIYIREDPEQSIISPRPLKFILDEFAPRTEVPYVPDYLSLKRISFPTGGYTEYEYEKNYYSDVELYASRVESAGIRIKKITSSDLLNNEALVRSYKYGNGESGYGIGSFFVDHDLFVNENILMNFNNYFAHIPRGFVQRVVTYSSSMQGDAGIVVGQSAFVRYPYVTEYYSSSSDGNGKTIYSFDIGSTFATGRMDQKNVIPNEYYPRYPIYINKYSHWNKPYLIWKEVYDKDNKLVKSEEYKYERSYDSFTGLKIRQSVSLFPDDPPEPVNYFSQLDQYILRSFFDYSIYTYDIGKNELKGKIEYDYFDGQTIISESSYEYSNLLLSRESIKRSTGDTLVSYIAYPLDYASGTLFIDDMKMNGLIGYPIEKVDYLKSAGNHKVLSGTISKYQPGGKGLIESQWSTENKIPLNLSTFNFSNRGVGMLPPKGTPTVFSPDDTYAKKVTYDNYDFKGNIQQLHKEDDINITYLWGYNNSYPVAKIENASLQEVKNVFDGSIPDLKYGGLSPVQNTSLRTGLPKAMVTTYTYRLLTGMTSQTDPNGITTYYEYDSFGRLKLIKDNDGRILKTYEYHYGQ